jgi:hypothetical protein
MQRVTEKGNQWVTGKGMQRVTEKGNQWVTGKEMQRVAVRFRWMAST